MHITSSLVLQRHSQEVLVLDYQASRSRLGENGRNLELLMHSVFPIYWCSNNNWAFNVDVVAIAGGYSLEQLDSEPFNTALAA